MSEWETMGTLLPSRARDQLTVANGPTQRPASAGRLPARPVVRGRPRGVFLAHLFHVKLQPVTLKPHTHGRGRLVQSIGPLLSSVPLPARVGCCGTAVMFGSCPLVLHLRTAHRRPSSSRSPPPPLCLKAKQNCAPSLHVPHRVLSGCRSICGT